MDSNLRIVWAVDPNERGDTALHHRSRKVLRRLLGVSAENVVEPVYVFRISTAVTADLGAHWRKELVEAAEEALRRFLRHAKIPGLAEPRVLVSTSSSYRRAAGALSEYAGRTGADLVVAQTHGRSGFGRFVLGSFAETLLLLAKTPVLLVNPTTHVPKTIANILFPTDFGRSAANQFREVLDLADRFGAKVTLLHVIDHESEAVLLAGIAGPAPILPDHRVDRIQRAKKHAHAWTEIADRHGVTVDFVLRERGRNPGEEILTIAERENVGLIAMQTNAGTLSATLLGSNTRHVVRKARCPVWILKPAPHRPMPIARPDRLRGAPKPGQMHI